MFITEKCGSCKRRSRKIADITTINWLLHAFITNIIPVDREPTAFGNEDSIICIEELAGGYGVRF
jgi:hypothetical protein